MLGSALAWLRLRCIDFVLKFEFPEFNPISCGVERGRGTGYPDFPNLENLSFQEILELLLCGETNLF